MKSGVDAMPLFLLDHLLSKPRGMSVCYIHDSLTIIPYLPNLVGMKPS